MLNINRNNFTEKNGITTNTNYYFAGVNARDGRAIYEKIITRFSISRGVIDDHKRTGKYYDAAGNEHTPIFKNNNYYFAEV